MAEHSMCQPGRPFPHGESHAGSPGLADFQSAKSTGLRLRSSTSMRAPAEPSRSSSRRCASSPYSGNDVTSKYTPWPSTTYALPESTSSPMSLTIRSMYAVARGSESGRRTPTRSISAQYAASYRCATSGSLLPSSAARRMILSSTSVMLVTYVTSSPRHSR